MTWVNLAPGKTFVTEWFGTFVFAWLIMMPLGFAIFRGVDWLINVLLPGARPLFKNLSFGLLMALCMETLMASATAYKAVGLEDMQVFLNTLGAGLIAAIPFGVIMAIVIATLVKPRLNAR